MLAGSLLLHTLVGEAPEELEKVSLFAKDVRPFPTDPPQFHASFKQVCADEVLKQKATLESLSFPWVDEAVESIKQGREFTNNSCPLTFMNSTRRVKLANVQGLMLKYLFEAPVENFFPAFQVFSKGLREFPEFPGDPHPLFVHLAEVFEQANRDFHSPRKPEGALSSFAGWTVQDDHLHLQVDGVIFLKPTPLLKEWTRLWDLGKHWDPDKLPQENRPLVREDWGALDLEELAAQKHPLAILYFCEQAEGWAEVEKWTGKVETAGIRIDSSYLPRWRKRLENILEEYFWSARGNFSNSATQDLDMSFPLNKAASLLNAFGLNLVPPAQEEISHAYTLIMGDESAFAHLLRGVGEWTSAFTRHFDLGRVREYHLQKAVDKGNRFAMWLLARKKMLLPPEANRKVVLELLEEAATRSWRAQKNLAEMGYRFPFLQYKTLREQGGSFECTSIPFAWQEERMCMLVQELETDQAENPEEPPSKRRGASLSTPSKRRKKNSPLVYEWDLWGQEGRHLKEPYLKGKQSSDWDRLLDNEEFRGCLETWADALRCASRTIFERVNRLVPLAEAKPVLVLQFFKEHIVSILHEAKSQPSYLEGVSFTMFAEWFLLPFKPEGGWDVSWNDFQKLNQGRQVTTREYKLFCRMAEF